ncbi:MAG: SpoIIE family protein phosphatase [Desulfamplus sp.]|nr:SpoIIE family protein phosphatase [Desulfamplus sp.]MBF0390645.1 SpoIIE family protein phosphatase [Desulfamplus sp.]
MAKIDFHIAKRSLTGWEDECGDTGVAVVSDDQCFVALVDVLGHGKEAYDVALIAEKYLLENYHLNLIEIIKGLHEHLKGTRGAVAALCRINLNDGVLLYSGIGNINTRVLSSRNLILMPRDGIIGYMSSSPKERQLKLYSGDTLILTSDGVKEHINFGDYPELLKGSANEIANNMLDLFSKGNDDSSCIVLRYGI